MKTVGRPRTAIGRSTTVVRAIVHRRRWDDWRLKPHYMGFELVDGRVRTLAPAPAAGSR